MNDLNFGSLKAGDLVKLDPSSFPGKYKRICNSNDVFLLLEEPNLRATRPLVYVLVKGQVMLLQYDLLILADEVI